MRTIATFWHGAAFGPYEQLSVRSFVAAGHPVEVYSYDRMSLPAGVVSRDAGEILPREELFTYRDKGAGSYAGFANRFRYKLLLDRGGVWVDADVLCLRPFTDLPDNFAGYQDLRSMVINNAVLGFERGSALCRQLYRSATDMGNDIQRKQTGPKLLTRLHGEQRWPGVRMFGPDHFYPVHFNELEIALLPEHREKATRSTRRSYCVHWWNEIFRKHGLPKAKLPPKGSFLGDRAFSLLGDEVAYCTADEMRSALAGYMAAMEERRRKPGAPVDSPLRAFLRKQVLLHAPTRVVRLARRLRQGGRAMAGKALQG